MNIVGEDRGKGGEENFTGKKRNRRGGVRTFWLLRYNSEGEIFVVCVGRRERLAR